MSDPVVRSLSSQLRTLARLAAQWADVLDSSAEPVPVAIPPSGSAASTSTAPVIFACASCGARTVWDVDGYARPWPNAMCKACYAEFRMRRDEIQDAVVGYTGVR